jgi:hypothetical protein
MRNKMAISMAVGALLLIGIMTTSVLASKSTAVANSASLAANTAVSTQLRTNAFSVVPADVCPPKFVPPDPVVAGEDEVPEVGAVDKLEEDVTFDDLEAMEVDDIKAMVPETYEETDAQICCRVRFLIYTHDGKHIMWGYVGNGYFVGQDNLGKRCWGIYGNGIFAGFYDGEFFWGKYRCGNWKAIGLFGENYSHGKYILFPTVTATRP